MRHVRMSLLLSSQPRHTVPNKKSRQTEATARLSCPIIIITTTAAKVDGFGVRWVCGYTYCLQSTASDCRHHRLAARCTTVCNTVMHLVKRWLLRAAVLSIYLSICLSIYLSICLSVCLSVCLSEEKCDGVNTTRSRCGTIHHVCLILLLLLHLIGRP